jgi:hypothetical protein
MGRRSALLMPRPCVDKFAGGKVIFVKQVTEKNDGPRANLCIWPCRQVGDTEGVLAESEGIGQRR